MHAALVSLRIDPNQAPAAASAFSNDILPKVQSASGLLAGYWVDPEDGQGFGFLVFDTEDNARKGTPPESNWSAPGVTILDTQIRRIAVDIPDRRRA